MASFFDWFNNGEKVNLMLKAGMAHLWFVTIHPFDDGNGRIARAIADLCLKGEHVYAAFGQTKSGRYLIVFFIYEGRGSALPISGRDMTSRERGFYDEQKEAS